MFGSTVCADCCIYNKNDDFNQSLTKASRPTPNSVDLFSAKVCGGAAHARRSVQINVR
jgi:hypothetical protein